MHLIVHLIVHLINQMFVGRMQMLECWNDWLLMSRQCGGSEGGREGGREERREGGGGREGRDREMEKERERLRYCGSVIPTQRQPCQSRRRRRLENRRLRQRRQGGRMFNARVHRRQRTTWRRRSAAPNRCPSTYLSCSTSSNLHPFSDVYSNCSWKTMPPSRSLEALMHDSNVSLMRYHCWFRSRTRVRWCKQYNKQSIIFDIAFNAPQHGHRVLHKCWLRTRIHACNKQWYADTLPANV